MGKALKTFIILNLLLSLAVVWFGIEHFNDREVIKARGLMHEATLRDVSQNLGWGREIDREEAQDRKPGTFTVPQPITVEELGNLDMALNELSRFATQRFAQLNQRTSQLISEEQAHANTERIRSETQAQLDTTRADLQRTRATLEQTQNELQQANRTIDGLRADKSNLERQVASLTTELAEKNERIDTLEIDLEARTAELNRAMDRIERLERWRSTGNADGPQGIWSGVPATVLEVDTQWQYVVIDLGEIDRLELFLNAFVHRGDEYIGQVNVIRVENTVAVAEILQHTIQPGLTIQPGDTIFFN
jgi:multidrug efflux pump subunit AcrA (membrane-fusion protein)